MKLPTKDKKIDWSRVIALCRNINGTIGVVNAKSESLAMLVCLETGCVRDPDGSMSREELKPFSAAAKKLGFTVVVSRYAGAKCFGQNSK